MFGSSPSRGIVLRANSSTKAAELMLNSGSRLEIGGVHALKHLLGMR